MKIGNLLLIIVVFLPVMSACSHQSKNSQNGIVTLDFTRDYDGITMNLSDLADDLSVIRLETNENSLMSYFSGFVGDRYIISFGNKSIMLFTSNGKFIETLIRKGKGPDEFSQIDAWTVDDAEQFLYYHDIKKDYIYKYDLSSQKLHSKLPFKDKGYLTKMLLLNDTTFAILPSMFASYGYLYFFQSLSGKIVGGLTKENVPHPGAWAGRSSVFYKSTNNSIVYQPSELDTIFSITETDMTPLVSFKLKAPFKNGSKTTVENVFLNHLYKDEVLLGKAIYEKNITPTSASMRLLGSGLYISDLKSTDINRVDSIYYDDIGIWLDVAEMNILSSKRFIVVYEAMQFKVLLKNAIKNSLLPDDKKVFLKTLNSNIADDDNPIIISGNYRE